jgi:hypothetical protein
MSTTHDKEMIEDGLGGHPQEDSGVASSKVVSGGSCVKRLSRRPGVPASWRHAGPSGAEHGSGQTQPQADPKTITLR